MAQPCTGSVMFAGGLPAVVGIGQQYPHTVYRTMKAARKQQQALHSSTTSRREGRRYMYYYYVECM